MKRILAALLAFIMLLLVSCGTGSQAQGGGEETFPGAGGGSGHTEHVDANADGKCDECQSVVEINCIWHYDINRDDICDSCGKNLKVECSTHKDKDGNFICDVCGERAIDPSDCTHVDSDNDGSCDFCEKNMGAVCTSHEDSDGDKRCDVCAAGLSEECASHTDTDNNGRCDDCNVTVVFVFDFYALNDMHGKLDDTDSCVGVDELTTYIKQSSLTDEHSIVLSSGDMWQGSSESNLTKGLIVTEWMNDVGFVSMTLGNHEYDWGAEYIKENAEIASFPFLAINIYYTETDTPVEYCKPSVMVERGGVKIGIIGAIGDCYSSISSSRVEDVTFKVGDELTELIMAESERLRSLGAELIVLSLHDGYSRSSSGVSNISSSKMKYYYDASLSNGYIDLVFEGHTHASYVHVDSYGVYHLQNGGYDNGISHIELAVNIATDSTKVTKAEIVENEEYRSLDDDPIVDGLLEKYTDQLSAAYRTLGYNDSYRNASFLKSLVAELYYKKGYSTWGDEYDIVLGGGYISVRDPGALYVGEVIYSDLMSILPFDNDIVLCSVKGRDLLAQFINTQNTNYYVYYGEYGESVKNSIDESATYYIIADSYSADYKPNALTVVDRLDSVTFARDLLAEYIEEGGLGGYELTSVPDALAIGGMLEYNVESTELYYIKGTVVEQPDATYGDTTIRDDLGNEIYVYGIRSKTGGLFSDMTDPPKLGDTVILCGVLYHYKNPATGETKVELKSATVIMRKAS